MSAFALRDGGGFEEVPLLLRATKLARLALIGSLLDGETERLRDRDLRFSGEAFFRPRRISRRLLCARGTNILA